MFKKMSGLYPIRKTSEQDSLLRQYHLHHENERGPRGDEADHEARDQEQTPVGSKSCKRRRDSISVLGSLQPKEGHGGFARGIRSPGALKNHSANSH